MVLGGWLPLLANVFKSTFGHWRNSTCDTEVDDSVGKDYVVTLTFERDLLHITETGSPHTPQPFFLGIRKKLCFSYSNHSQPVPPPIYEILRLLGVPNAIERAGSQGLFPTTDFTTRSSRVRELAAVAKGTKDTARGSLRLDQLLM